MESGLDGQMPTHRHQEDESLTKMGSGRFGYFSWEIVGNFAFSK